MASKSEECVSECVQAERRIDEFLSASGRLETLERPTLAAEVLALHPPVVIAVVKPSEEKAPVYHIIFI